MGADNNMNIYFYLSIFVSYEMWIKNFSRHNFANKN